ncbi:MAG: tRNA (N(6)-L-threonylcarbamoyladenosine(37)-C(2))-methylthiotransferase MtaB [Bacteroidetes bacterium]|nr:tRNA (N(6)-L-threonylcarbamoyladenosine(37)-C(2))-methylthiotransferase MtaB [Bacteroidota bacterium]
MGKKKVAFQTFGCKLNFSETSGISKSFLKEGYNTVDFRDEADVYVINSCTVTENAEKKCKTAIKQANKRNPKARIAIIGCFSQINPSELAKMGGVDLVLGNNDKFKILDHLNELDNSSNEETIIATSDLKTDLDFFPSYSSGDRTRSFLKVQDGCDYFCTFCTIPHARGRSRSNTIETTLKVAKKIADSEIQEIILTGVNVGDFGKRNNEHFIDLLKALDEINGIERIRISSIEPELLSNEIIHFVANSNKFLPHFHIPLQSGSKRILKEMKRKYTPTLFADRILTIKKLIPNCLIAADVIVGFPGESDADFQESYEFIRDSEITYTHVFSYSARPGTIASRIDNKIPKEKIKERSRKLQQLSNRKKSNFYNQHIGSKLNVLFEANNSHSFMHGFTENYIKVKTNYNSDLINKIIEVTLIKIDKEGIFEIGF